MSGKVPLLFAPTEPAELLRLAGLWAEQIHSASGAYRVVSELSAALASIALGPAEEELQPLRAALASHALTGLLRRDPLVARAWRSNPGRRAPDRQLADLMLRHPDAEPIVAAADAVGRNVFAATSGLPTCEAVREHRRLLARLADQAAEERPGARILAIAPPHLREAEIAAEGPTGGIGRWVGLVEDAATATAIATELPLPWVTLHAGRVIGALDRYDLGGVFDFAYCKSIAYFPTGEAEAITRLAFARLRPGGRMLLTTWAAASPDRAFWSLGGARLVARDEAQLARLVTVLPESEIAERRVFPSINGALLYLEVIRR